MKISILSLFPEIFQGFKEASLIGKARERGLLDLGFVNIRDFTMDRHRSVDDTPYGGGCGMVMKPDSLALAVKDTEEKRGSSHRIFLTPQGSPLTGSKLVELAERDHLMFVCGRYEGVDERFREKYIHEEISLGDFILSGGEVAAMALVEGVGRLIPGVMGNKGSASEESFSGPQLEYPQYTRPPEFEGMKVPEVLLKGHHEEIRRWRQDQAEKRTRERRPDLLETGTLERRRSKQKDESRKKNLLTRDASRTYVALLHHPVLDRNGKVVTTALTNLDLHDIARASRTFELGGYFVVTPVQKQRELASRIVGHWVDGKGALANSRRRKALDLVQVAKDLDEVVSSVKKTHGVAPILVATTADSKNRSVVCSDELFRRPETVNRPLVLVFGTGWGLTREVLDGVDLLLEPILGPGDYNHLSVRSAVAVYLARLFSRRP